jgi:CheY-like chemotaxis protein
MSEAMLQGCRILVVEDEYMIADEICDGLADAGATVVGPAATREDAVGLIESGPVIDCALLDLNLRGEPAYPIADLLMQRGTPFVFTTGYDLSSIPSRYTHVPRCEKPVSIAEVIQTIARLVQR